MARLTLFETGHVSAGGRSQVTSDLNRGLEDPLMLTVQYGSMLLGRTSRLMLTQTFDIGPEAGHSCH